MKTMRLQPYMKRNVVSLREKERVREVVSLSPRLTVLELGCAADDTILWQVGTTCISLRSRIIL